MRTPWNPSSRGKGRGTHKDNVGSKIQRNVRVINSKKQVFTLVRLAFEVVSVDAEKDPTDFNADAIFARFFP